MFVPALVVATFSCLLVTGDVSDVWCRWNASCVLEANYITGDEVVIHWILGEVQVHSYYYEADQLANQDKRFTGRTSLFKEKIVEGNASLLLNHVVVGDEGKYKCYVGTLTGTSESFINLHVEAPVTTIHVHQDDNHQLICSSEGIFPQPELRWGTEPALPQALRNTSQVQRETQTQLYNISGSLDLAADADTDVEYICEIRSFNSSRRVTRRNTIMNVSETETSIDCVPVTHESSLVWTFNRSQVIASRRAGHELYITDDWRKYVRGVSVAGSLNLQELNDGLDGTYTCTLSNATETRINAVFLRVKTVVESYKTVLGVLGVVALALAVCVIYFTRKREGCSCRRDRVPRQAAELM